MEHASVIADLAIVLGVAAPIAIAFRAIRLPTILGYLAAGLIVGPYIPIPLFADPERTRALSEFGVVLVMFAVGLELSLRRAARVLPIAGITALVQIGGLFWGGNLVGRALGLSGVESFFLGSSVAISSTMVVVKVFEDRPPPVDVRAFVFGVLVLQDLVAIVLLAIVTVVATGGGVTPEHILHTLGRLVGVILLAIVVGLLVLPRLVRWIADRGTTEVLVVFATGACFGLAAAAEHLGYSVALGAFLAGMIVAESGRARRVEHLVVPIRDVFAAVFFVSIGMQVDPIVALHSLPTAIVLAACIVVLQFLTVSGAGVLSGAGLRRAVQAGLALGQVGEFGFIIMGIGVAAGVVAPALFTIVVTTAVLTAFTTSLAVRIAPRLAAALDRRLPDRVRDNLSLYDAWLDALRRGDDQPTRRRRVRRLLRILLLEASIVATIVIATAVGSPRLVDVLVDRLAIAPWVAGLALVAAAAALAIPFVRGLLQAARRLGAMLGEAVFPERDDRKTDLTAMSRRVMSVALQLAVLLAIGVPLAAITQPFVPFGIGAIVLAIMLVPTGVYLWRTAEDLHAHVRSASEALIAVLGHGLAKGEEPALDDLLHGLGDLTALTLPDGAPAIDKTLKELDLRATTGATVLAIARSRGGVVTPTGSERLHAGDCLGLTGSEAAIARAHSLLLGTEPSSEPADDGAEA